MSGSFTRRRLLQMLLSLPPALRLAQGRALASEESPPRIVIMSWELTETLLLLGHVPVGLSLPTWYSSTMIEPKLPEGVVDIGLLYQPNFQVLLELSPDLLILTPGHAPLKPALEHVAPALTLGAYIGAAEPYPALLHDTRCMAAALKCQDRAEALIEESERLFDDARRRLSVQHVRSERRLIIADAIDEHYLRIYGQGSLFDAILRKIGLDNQAAPANGLAGLSGGSALIPVQRLAEIGNSHLLLMSPLAPRVRTALQGSPVWRALPSVRQKRVAQLPVIAPYGGLRSMQRFAQAVAHILLMSDARETADV